jgi:hypothetical protein
MRSRPLPWRRRSGCSASGVTLPATVTSVVVPGLDVAFPGTGRLHRSRASMSPCRGLDRNLILSRRTAETGRTQFSGRCVVLARRLVW